MITVYFETEHPAYAEQVATFISEEVYAVCLPALEALAKEHHFDFVSESVDGEKNLGIEVFVNGVWDTSHEDRPAPNAVLIYDKGEVNRIQIGEYEKFIDQLEKKGFDCYFCPQLYKHPLWNGEIEYVQDEQ